LNTSGRIEFRSRKPIAFLPPPAQPLFIAVIPGGEIVSADNALEECPVLMSRRYGLKGKPDSLVRTPSGDLIPVERKTMRAPRRPYDGNLIQATAYCVLVEEEYGRTPPFMRIQ
jgi:hypothetical protein